VSQILINREVVSQPNCFDVELLGDSDVIVEELCRRLGWGALSEGLSFTDCEEGGKEMKYEAPNRYVFGSSRSGGGGGDDMYDDEEEEKTEEGDDSALDSMVRQVLTAEEVMTVEPTRSSQFFLNEAYNFKFFG